MAKHIDRMVNTQMLKAAKQTNWQKITGQTTRAERLSALEHSLDRLSDLFRSGSDSLIGFVTPFTGCYLGVVGLVGGRGIGSLIRGCITPHMNKKSRVKS